MNERHQRIGVAVGMLCVGLTVGNVRAGDWTITAGGTYPISAQIGGGANLAAGDSIICDGSVNTTGVTIQIDSAAVPALGDAGGAAIQITAAVSVTIEFQGTNTVPLGNGASTSIAIGGGGSLAVTNAGGATGYFDFATNNTGNTLTINGPVSGTDAVNRFAIGNNILNTTTATVTLNDVILGGANAKIDADIATTIDTLAFTTTGDDFTIEIAEGLTFTIDDQFTIGAGSVVTVTTVDGGVAETLTLNNGMDLAGAAAELTIGGDDTNATAINGTLTVNTDGGVLDVNNGATITAVSMSAAAGNLTMEIAAGKTLTTTVDVNDNTLTLSQTGTLTTVTMDTVGGKLDVDASCTVTTCTISASIAVEVAGGQTLTVSNSLRTGAGTLTLSGPGIVSSIIVDSSSGSVKLTAATGTITALAVNESCVLDLDADGCILHIGNEIDLGARTLTVRGSGGGNMETLVATIDLDNTSSKLILDGSSGDNIGINILKISTGDVNLQTNVDCRLFTVQFNDAATFTFSDNPTVTSALNIGAQALTTSGTGTISTILASTGRVIANDGTLTITTLTPSPTTGKTFTLGGLGAMIVTTLTPLDAEGEILNKLGTGTLTFANGFDFSIGRGIVLDIDAGTVVDQATGEIRFGDDAEEITVASGAIYTLGRDMTGYTGSNTHLDAAAGSTINFNKQGTLTLTSANDDDFKLLGTVEIQDGCTLQMAGAYQTQLGSVNVNNTAALLNNGPGASMLFEPNAIVSLLGTSSGTLTIDGQAAETPVTLNTNTGAGTFTIARGRSTNMTLGYVALGNCTYSSYDDGYAEDELDLSGVTDLGGTINWYRAFSCEAGADVTVISGNSTVLSGSASGGSGSYAYSWTPTDTLQNPRTTTPTATPTATTTYTLTVTDRAETEQTTTDTVTVTVTPALSVSAGEDQTIDSGASATLAGSASGGSGTFAYAWAPTDGLDDPTSPTPVASPGATTTYTLTVTDTGDGDKTAADEVVITVTSGGATIAPLCGAGGAGLMPFALTALWCCRRRWRRPGRSRG